METFCIIKVVNETDFREWFWGKFEEWRKGTVKGPTAFARYLDPGQTIVKQQYVSDMLQGKYKPKSAELIAKLAEHFPEIYKILNIPEPKREIPWSQLPAPMRIKFEAAHDEWVKALEVRKLDPESSEAIKLAVEIFGKHGLRVELTDIEYPG